MSTGSDSRMPEASVASSEYDPQASVADRRTMPGLCSLFGWPSGHPHQRARCI